jgi:hypothetical protein
MDKIDRKVWSFLPGTAQPQRCTVPDVMASRGYDIESFPALVEAVASVGYANRRHNLFFRGQDSDYTIYSQGKHRRISSVLPSIYRPPRGNKTVPAALLAERFIELDALANEVAASYRDSGHFGSWKRIGRYPELRWALLQHYQVCPTPLIDLTQSLRVAASFATAGGRGKTAMLQVFGLPHVNGSISYHVDESLVIVKLQSICPPAAKRAHYQEGFLAAHFPPTGERTLAVNLGYRMLAKFRLRKEGFWDDKFLRIPWPALMPDDDAVKGYFDGVLERYLARIRGEA